MRVLLITIWSICYQKKTKKIKILREKNINISHTVTELNAKIEELESEKQSLKTALKILYADLETAEGNIRLQADKHEVYQYPWLAASGKLKIHPVSPELNSNNKYLVLHIDDDTDAIISGDEIKGSENSVACKNKHPPHHAYT